MFNNAQEKILGNTPKRSVKVPKQKVNVTNKTIKKEVEPNEPKETMSDFEKKMKKIIRG